MTISPTLHHHNIGPREIDHVNQSAYDEAEETPSPWANRFVEWIREPTPSILVKIMKYFLATIVVLALAFSCFGLPTAADIMHNYHKRASEDKLEKLDKPIMDTLGGKIKYDALPDLGLQNNDASSLYFDPEQLSEAIMKGTDRFNRPVLCLKIFDTTKRITFVEVIYRLYSRQSYENPWVVSPSKDSIFEGVLSLKKEEISKLRGILRNKDGRYQLAT